MVNVPALGPVAFTVPAQIVTIFSLLIGAFATWSCLNGLLHIAQGASQFSGAKGRPQKREEAVETAKDGAWGLAIGAAMIGIIGIVRSAMGV